MLTANKLPQAIVGKIEELCQPYIQMRGGLDGCFAQPLYRGMKIIDGQSIHNSHDYREPQSMPIVLHHRIDQWFHDTHGHCFRSVNAVFCTGSLEQAQAFNPAHAIFPIGEFKFAWSPSIADLTKYVNAELNALIDTPDDGFWKRLLGYSDPKTLTKDEQTLRVKALAMCGDLLKDFERDNTFKTDQLLGGIESNKEVMLICWQYFAFLI